MTIAHHEAGHAVAALHFGRQVDFVGRDRHNGLTTYAPDPPDGDVKRYAVESGVICLAPYFESTEGCAGDLLMLDGLLAVGVSLSQVWEETAALVADPEYRRRVRVLEQALWQHPVLSGEEVVLLLAAP
jgi:hypothetical protein